MNEQTLFELYLSGSITHAQYIGNLKQVNEKHIQNQSSKKKTSSTTSKQQETPSVEEDTWFI
jgi:hypothetical protein